MKTKRRFRIFAVAVIVLATVFSVAIFGACGDDAEENAGRLHGLTTDEYWEENGGSDDGSIKLENGDHYEAEYAVIEGESADASVGYYGFVRSRNDMSNKYVLVRMSRPGNTVTFKVNSDKAEDDVTLVACVAAMNNSSRAGYSHREADFDSVYKLIVNGTECPQNVTYGWEGAAKEQWFDMVEVRLTIDLKEGENTIQFLVPERSYVEGITEDNNSLYVAPNFDYIYFETDSASLTYKPYYDNEMEGRN